MLHHALRNIFAAALLILSAATAWGQLTAAKAFSTMPDKLMPLLDRSTRLDMIDYFNSGSSTPSKNSMAGQSRIMELTPQTAVVQLSPASTCEIALLPAGSDTLIAVISTVATPAPDSKLHVYTSDWSRDLTSQVFTAPQLTDWLTGDGRKNIAEVETMVPFMLAGGKYDPATGSYVLTNNVSQFLTEEVYKPMSGYFQPTLVYKWNGKRFNK